LKNTFNLFENSNQPRRSPPNFGIVSRAEDDEAEAGSALAIEEEDADDEDDEEEDEDPDARPRRLMAGS
jgi:hypothetical protein